MFDLDKVVPPQKAVDHDDDQFQDLSGRWHITQTSAQQSNLIIILAAVSNNLERIANTQELLQKQGEEAVKKADSTLQAAMGAFKGLKL